MTDDKTYYIYLHRKATNGDIFYVGKGSGNRAYDTSKKGRNQYWHRVRDKYGLEIEILFDNLTEEEAFQCEKDVILELEYFSCKLTNLTKGGEGPSGVQFTDTQRLNIQKGLREKRYGNLERKIIEVKRPSSYGENNHFADTNEYSFVRLEDGFEITCTRHALAELYGADKQLIKKLFYKNPRKSADGWRLKKE